MKSQTKRPAKPRARGGWIRSLLRRMVPWIAVGVAIFYTVACLSLAYLRWFRPLTTGVQVERHVQAILSGKPYQKHYDWVPLKSISPSLQHAVVAAEDARFYEHHGIDWKEVSKVAEESLEEGEVTRGGSTITQQLVKNLFLTTARSPIRKAIEFALVPPTELILPKSRILELYLNVIEWGPGVFGAEAAARYHYNTSAAQLTRDESARLAAIIPSPRRRKPARMNGIRREDLDANAADGLVIRCAGLAPPQFLAASGRDAAPRRHRCSPFRWGRQTGAEPTSLRQSTPSQTAVSITTQAFQYPLGALADACCRAEDSLNRVSM